MFVARMPLPGPATVVVFGPARSIMLDARLTRDEAVLAITGVLPHAHPDVVDHWLDTVFERRRLPFTARQVGTLSGVVLACLGLFVPRASVTPGHMGVTNRRAPIMLMVAGTQTS